VIYLIYERSSPDADPWETARMSAFTSAPGLVVQLGDDGVLRIVLDRPEKRNALDDVMIAGMIAAVEQAGSDEAVRAILITGRGDHFCGGFDIVGRNTASGGEGEARPARPRVGSIQRRLPAQAHRLIPLLATVQTPVVCVVRGWAAGIGLHLVLASDVTIAADDATFWEPFAERGFTPDSGGTWLLPRRIGDTRARAMLLLGQAVHGTEAAEWGLVHAAVPAERLEAEANAVVARLATGPTVALGLSKWLLHAGASSSLDDHLRDEAFAMELSSRSEDFREGLTAFREKRPPRFSGR
jgi:2-(1,2-epoxy-1,2-dihydrophenyl)acetyl-CoA isomerase